MHTRIKQYNLLFIEKFLTTDMHVALGFPFFFLIFNTNFYTFI